MKKIRLLTLCIFLFGCFTIVQAQTISTTLYFESGQHQLTKASTLELESFLVKISKLKDFDLDLKAYTDDIGTAEYNQKLAERRATSVKEFLDGHGIQPSFTEIEKLGEIALVEDADQVTQRQNNRRVDIAVTAFQPHSLDDMYGYLLNRRTGQEKIDIRQDNVIFGPKGTELYLPRNCFQLVDGSPVDFNEVQITLQEAYDNRDFILHNLTTMSDGELIETAGMVYIDAQTLDGRKLELVPGIELMVAMPSADVLPEDMQLFTADRTATNSAMPINWDAQGQNFLSTDFNNKVPKFNFEEFELKMLPLITSPNISAWPTRVEKPLLPELPVRQAIRETNPPTLEEVTAANVPYEKESDKKYLARMESTFENAKKQSEANILFNANAEKYYQKQLLEYTEATKNYELAQAKYLDYESKVRAIQQELFDKKEDLKLWFHNMHWAEAGFEQEMKTMVFSFKKFLKLKTFLEFECKRLEMTEDLAFVKEAELKQSKLIISLGIKFLNCARHNKQFDHSHNISATERFVDELLASPNYMELPLFEENSAIANVERIHRKIIAMYGAAQVQNMVTENYNEILTLSNFKENAQKLDSLCYLFTQIQEKVLAEKLARGWMSPETARSNFSNMVMVNSLGWINCDRFLRAKKDERKISLTVKDELIASDTPEEVQYYVIFSTVRGVMNMSASSDFPDLFSTRNIPENEPVKIVGIRVVEDHVEVGIYEGLAKDVQDLKLRFVPKTLNELRYLL